VRQLGLRERLLVERGRFVIWDVGLGAAANVLTVLRATRDIPSSLRFLSFDHTLGPLEFALQHAAELGYLTGYEEHLRLLLREPHLDFTENNQRVQWEVHLADFPTLLLRPATQRLPKPH